MADTMTRPPSVSGLMPRRSIGQPRLRLVETGAELQVAEDLDRLHDHGALIRAFRACAATHDDWQVIRSVIHSAAEVCRHGEV